MKVLVVDGGGRGHALAWKLAQSRHVTEVVCAPGNGGTALERKCRNVAIAATDIPALIRFSEEERIDLTVVGPEAPLVEGIVDQWTYGRIWGPNAQLALLEGSKIHAKETMLRLGVPTAPFVVFDSVTDAMTWVKTQSERPLVVKADGLAAGKGVEVCDTLAQVEAAIQRVMVAREFGVAGDRILIEERLFGREASLLALCAGGKVLLLDPAKDYKPIGEGDTGPNTGGMGCYSPVPSLTDKMISEVCGRVILPVVQATGYTGVLYVGLMLTDQGPQVLEFNVRFGDPETQVILPRLEDDLAQILHEAAAGNFPVNQLRWSSDCAVSVVMAAGGYPGDCPKGDVITGLDKVAQMMPRIIIFHAGTKLQDGNIVTNGGRVLNVTGLGPTHSAARAKVYAAVSQIGWKGAVYRRDIAQSI